MFTADPVDRRFSQTQELYAANDLETMLQAERYGAQLFKLLRPHLGARVLEVGSGIGTMTRQLAAVSQLVVGVEPNPHCAGVLQRTMEGYTNFALRTCHLEECDRDEIANYRFDTVVCVNVLEHIENDAAAVRTFRNAIVPNGRVFIFVPAVQAAYGPLDAELGHHRRYSKDRLSGLFADAGLNLLTLRYTNPIGLLGWMYNARISRSTAHSPFQVKLFDKLVAPWAFPLERLVTPPIGLSLVAVGQRSD